MVWARPSTRVSSPVARVSEVGSTQRSALRQDYPAADPPAAVVAPQGVKVRHACERPVCHDHEAFGPRGHQVVLLAGDDDVRHVMSDGVPRQELFLERGFDGVSVGDIAERAEVGRTTFFRHFGDKQEVVFAKEQELLETIAAAGQADGTAAARSATEAVEQLRPVPLAL